MRYSHKQLYQCLDLYQSMWQFSFFLYIFKPKPFNNYKTQMIIIICVVNDMVLTSQREGCSHLQLKIIQAERFVS